MIIDRFEGIYAICESEDKVFVCIPRADLPPTVKEGDCLIQNDKGTYDIDVESTEKRKNIIRNKMRKLFETQQ